MPNKFEIYWKGEWLLRGEVLKNTLPLAKSVLSAILWLEQNTPRKDAVGGLKVPLEPVEVGPGSK